MTRSIKSAIPSLFRLLRQILLRSLVMRIGSLRLRMAQDIASF